MRNSLAAQWPPRGGPVDPLTRRSAWPGSPMSA